MLNYTPFLIRTSDFLAEAEPELNVLIFWRFEPETFLTMLLRLIEKHFTKSLFRRKERTNRSSSTNVLKVIHVCFSLISGR